MTKQWFVLQALTGQEQKVKKFIEAQTRNNGMEEYIGEVILPMEKVTETRSGVKTTTARKFFPGYVFINVALYDAQRELVEPSWRFIREVPGVIGFLGGDRPVPLSEEEVDNVVHHVEAKKEKPRPKVVYEPGESVKIMDGPFMNFTGVVDEVDPDRGKLKVSVAIFGRTAPVDLEYWQVERVVS